MKKLLLFAVLAITLPVVYGQKSIDALFDKYAGKDGFTTVTINGNLLKLARCLDDRDDDVDRIPLNITSIRILTQEDKTLKVENFYDMVMKDIDLGAFEEFMRVKEADQELKILVRTDGKIFREFLLIAGGDDNVLIQIKGEFSLDEVKKLSEDVRKNDGEDFVADHK